MEATKALYAYVVTAPYIADNCFICFGFRVGGSGLHQGSSYGCTVSSLSISSKIVSERTMPSQAPCVQYNLGRVVVRDG